MKVTLRSPSYSSLAHNNESEGEYALQKNNDVDYPVFSRFITQGRRILSIATLEAWSDAQLSSQPACKYTTNLAGLITTKKSNLLNKPPYSAGHTNTPTLETSTEPATNSGFLACSDSSEIWLFSLASQSLRNNCARIQLTTIESLLVKTLTECDARICSKQELINGINKNTHSYCGLEMCLSRLQSKFRGAYGERLFRSVRNRGYCLVQDVRIVDRPINRSHTVT